MIRVAVIDDHPTLCAGVAAVLRTEAGLSVVGTASSGAQTQSVLSRCHPAVVLLDHHLPDEDGLSVCHRTNASAPAPAVVMFSAFTTPSLAVAALVAGADGLLDKAASAHTLCEAVRAAARGRRRPWEISAEEAERAAASVDPVDAPLLRTLLEGATPREVMDVHGLGGADYDLRSTRVLAALRGAMASAAS